MSILSPRIHAERCGLMSTPVVGSPAQSANVGSTYSQNTSLSHAAVASVHPGFRSPDAGSCFSIKNCSAKLFCMLFVVNYIC